ncbi:MAG: hypothetical protein KKD73_11970 [Proteobacteria bacterium]|nr:hypothetical protein [Pseudomonadota bacterium]MBU1640757.1 hypothetical protein [Pseudomonadota bacterium]
MNSDHTRHLAALSDRIETDERIQELRAKMAFLITPGIDHNTLNSLCSDAPFMANQFVSEAAMKSFKRACLRFYDEKLRNLTQELAHLC